METLLIYLLTFFIPDHVTIWYILFWAIVIGLIAALVVAYKLQMSAKKVWLGLFSLEIGALAWANIASKWHLQWDSLAQNEILIPRIGVCIYTFLTMLSLISFCISIKSIR